MRLPAADVVRSRFEQQGVLLIPDFLSPAESEVLASNAASVAARYALHIRRSSEGSTLDYRVVTGDVIQKDAASIYEMYESTELLEWIRRVTATETVGRSPHVRSAVNINVLDTVGNSTGGTPTRCRSRPSCS